MALVPQKYSERLGVIEPDQLRQASDALQLGEVLDAWAPPAGAFGQNIVLQTSTGEYVLRGNPHGRDQLAKERRVARFIHEGSSLPAPWPYRICEDASAFGWSFAVMPRLPGESGIDLYAAQDQTGRVELCRATGDALACLHEAESDFFGPYDAQLDDFLEMDDFAEWYLGRLGHWRERCRAVDGLSTEAERFIDEVVETHAESLSEPFDPVLVHHDFTIGNLNFEPVGDEFEATGVFDLFEASLGDCEADLVRMLRTVETDEERLAFVETYVEQWPLRPGAAGRLAVYALADWLVVWELGRRHGLSAHFDSDATFVGATRPVVERARALGERFGP